MIYNYAQSGYSSHADYLIGKRIYVEKDGGKEDVQFRLENNAFVYY